jgi:prophage tail gpP-like protein
VPNPIIIITDRDGVIISTEPNYSSYTFNGELFSIADSFELVMADNTVDVSDWYGVQLEVDKNIIFNGTIQKFDRSFGPGTMELSLSGKDRGKFLNESYCTSFKEFKDIHPTVIVNKLIDQTAFYAQPVTNYTSVVPESDWDDPQQIAEYNTALINDIKQNKAFLRSENRTEFDSNFTNLPNKKKFKIEVGSTVGDTLVDLVRSVGMDIFYKPSGGLFIGDLDKERDSTSKKHVINLTDPDKGNNVTDANVTRDDSGRYSDITVISQTQNGKNDSATATDSSVIDKKSMVVAINDDESSPEKEAIRIRNDQLVESFSGSYSAPGHVDLDSGDPWTLNRNTRINDQINNVIGNFILESVTNTFEKEGDAYKTSLGFSHPRDPSLNV